MVIKLDPVPYFCDYANAEVIPKMGSYSDGSYVLATDYAALEVERDEWKRNAGEWKSLCNEAREQLRRALHAQGNGNE